MNTKNRISYWDNIKGFLIILVVFAHIIMPFQNNAIMDSMFDYIYMFHMPAFVFLSGFFGKSEKSHSFDAIAKLGFIYFVFNSILYLATGNDNILMPMNSYWYLIALIVWRLVTCHICNVKHIIIISCVSALIVGLFPSIDNTLAVSRIITFYPFYICGYLFSKGRADLIIHEKYSERLPKGLVFAAMGLFIAIISRIVFKFSDDELLMFNYENFADLFGRLFLMSIAALAILAILYLTPSDDLAFLPIFGRNSLWIYVLHRPVTLIISDLCENVNHGLVMIIAVIASFIICFVFGNDFVTKFLDKFVQQGLDIFKKDSKISFAKIVSIFMIIAFVITAFSDSRFSLKSISENSDSDIMYEAMSDEKQAEFDNAFSIIFAGDLILLEDQVKRAYKDNTYDFSDMFEYSEKYISDADLAIGVFEGPMAGERAGYSSSNYDDLKTLALNFPDEFGYAVKNAGFDLVTTANNHVLDKDIDGAMRTLDTLDSIGLDHTGSYRNAEEKELSRVKIIETQGIRFAILSYTYGSNDYLASDFIDSDISHITSIATGVSGEEFEYFKAQVEDDFVTAKSMNPDLIIVLPHMGTQFSNDIDAEQKTWYDIFKQNGADIILGDHAHAVEPVFISDYNGKSVFEAYCPGNFANIYRDKQGDTSMMIEVYIDRDNKTVIGGSVIPLYTQSNLDGNFRALPIYEMKYNQDLRSELSTDDMERSETAHNIITKTVFDREFDIDMITDRYYFDDTGFLRQRNNMLELSDKMLSSEVFKLMQDSNSICFLGDSVTEGTKNAGVPWYEPLIEYLDNKDISNISKGGCTVQYLTDNMNNIPVSDLYVIAIGTNDVRYRDESICAMTAEDYIDRINALRAGILVKNEAAKFVFIAPWYSTDGDIYSELLFEEKTILNNDYSNALCDFCSNTGDLFVNANDYISKQLRYNPDEKYLQDHIHPNAGEGVVMYSEAVLLSSD